MKVKWMNRNVERQSSWQLPIALSMSYLVLLPFPTVNMISLINSYIIWSWYFINIFSKVAINLRRLSLSNTFNASKVFECGVISGPYFFVFGLNTERYSVSLRIQTEYRKIRTRNNFVFGHFSRSVWIYQKNECIAIFRCDWFFEINRRFNAHAGKVFDIKRWTL